MNFDVVLKDDISTISTKRLAVKAIIDNTNKQEIKSNLPTFFEKLKKYSYSKPRTKQLFGETDFQVIYLYLYTHKRQANFGLPLCVAQWISDKIGPLEINHNDKVQDILINWDSLMCFIKVINHLYNFNFQK